VTVPGSSEIILDLQTHELLSSSDGHGGYGATSSIPVTKAPQVDTRAGPFNITPQHEGPLTPEESVRTILALPELRQLHSTLTNAITMDCILGALWEGCHQTMPTCQLEFHVLQETFGSLRLTHRLDALADDTLA
jgi:hypothetical protein